MERWEGGNITFVCMLIVQSKVLLTSSIFFFAGNGVSVRFPPHKLFVAVVPVVRFAKLRVQLPYAAI